MFGKAVLHIASFERQPLTLKRAASGPSREIVIFERVRSSSDASPRKRLRPAEQEREIPSFILEEAAETPFERATRFKLEALAIQALFPLERQPGQEKSREGR